MGSRLLPLSLALGAALADAAGAHQLGGLLVLLAIPCGLAAAVVSVSDVLEGRPAWLRACTSTGGLVLLLIGSAVRHGAPTGGSIPAFALSAVIAAAVLYLLPVLFWLLHPVSLRPAPRVSATGT